MKCADIKVIVVDDHTLVRDGLIRMLNSFPGIKVVAGAANGAEALKVAQSIAADVVTLDLSLPDVSGTSLIEAMRETIPGLPILILSMHDESALIKQVLKSGASGYVTKNADPDSLQAAITSVARGERYLPPNLAQTLAFEFAPEPKADAAPVLSQRERQVLRLIAEEGLSLVEIAQLLDLSPKTVTSHKANIMAKLGLANNAELIRYALSQPSDRLNG